jgi:hypothetical protein
MGETEGLYKGHVASIGNTYVLKIIYDIKMNKTFRLFMPGQVLFLYGWPMCENFWPF